MHLSTADVPHVVLGDWTEPCVLIFSWTLFKRSSTWLLVSWVSSTYIWLSLTEMGGHYQDIQPWNSLRKTDWLPAILDCNDILSRIDSSELSDDKLEMRGRDKHRKSILLWWNQFFCRSSCPWLMQQPKRWFLKGDLLLFWNANARLLTLDLHTNSRAVWFCMLLKILFTCL